LHKSHSNDNNSGTGGNNIGTLIDLMERIYISNFLSFGGTAKLKVKSSHLEHLNFVMRAANVLRAGGVL
jgi:hypothetical protein